MTDDTETELSIGLKELAALKAEIDRGLADLAEGRVHNFSIDRIIARGKKLLAEDYQSRSHQSIAFTAT